MYLCIVVQIKKKAYLSFTCWWHIYGVLYLTSNIPGGRSSQQDYLDGGGLQHKSCIQVPWERLEVRHCFLWHHELINKEISPESIEAYSESSIIIAKLVAVLILQCLVWSMYQNIRWVKNNQFQRWNNSKMKYQSFVFNCQVSAASILKQRECILFYWITVFTFKS